MSAYLATVKIAQNGRITLCSSALRNLGVKTGDELEIHFVEEKGCLLIKTAEPDQQGACNKAP